MHTKTKCYIVMLLVVSKITRNCLYTPNKSMLSDSHEAWTFEKLFSETSALIVIISNTLVESDWKTKLLHYKQALHNLQLKVEMGTSCGENTSLITRFHNNHLFSIIQTKLIQVKILSPKKLYVLASFIGASLS